MRYFCCCLGIGSVGSKISRQSVKLGYIFLFFLFATGLLVMSVMGDSIIKVFARMINCPTEADVSVCLGVSLVVR